jgi:hypothetical protein
MHLNHNSIHPLKCITWAAMVAFHRVYRGTRPRGPARSSAVPATPHTTSNIAIVVAIVNHWHAPTLGPPRGHPGLLQIPQHPQYRQSSTHTALMQPQQPIVPYLLARRPLHCSLLRVQGRPTAHRSPWEPLHQHNHVRVPRPAAVIYSPSNTASARKGNCVARHIRAAASTVHEATSPARKTCLRNMHRSHVAMCDAKITHARGQHCCHCTRAATAPVLHQQTADAAQVPIETIASPESPPWFVKLIAVH